MDIHGEEEHLMLDVIKNEYLASNKCFCFLNDIHE